MKKFNLLSILLLVSVGFFFSACDQTDPPYLADNETEFVIDTNKKKVLIEDFTGYTCGNCPNAGVIAHDLEHLYKERVIGIEVHVGSFAVPKAPHKEVYRSEASTESDE